MNGNADAIIISLLLSILVLGAVSVVGFYHRSKTWTGVSANARMERMERSHGILASNHHALSRDVTDFHREIRDTLDHMLEEVRKQHSSNDSQMDAALRDLRDHVDALEAGIAAIPLCPTLAALKSHEAT